MDLRQAAMKASGNRIARAYRDMTAVMADEQSTLEDLQGAVEYLLDVLRDVQQDHFLHH